MKLYMYHLNIFTIAVVRSFNVFNDSATTLLHCLLEKERIELPYICWKKYPNEYTNQRA